MYGLASSMTRDIYYGLISSFIKEFFFTAIAKTMMMKLIQKLLFFGEVIHLLLLLYGETVMTILHFWILIGYALPSLENMLQQPQWMTNMYLLSDLLLPMLVAASTITTTTTTSAITGRLPNTILLLLTLTTAHSILYLIFLYDNKQMIPVMEWAYSDWIQRRDGRGGEGIFAFLAVVLDTACHSWGMYILLLPQQQLQQEIGNNHNNDNKDNVKKKHNKLIAVSIGVIVAGITIAFLGTGQA